MERVWVSSPTSALFWGRIRAKKGLTPSPSPRGEESDMLCRCIAFWHKPRFYKFVFNLLLWTFRQHIAVLVPFSVFFFALSYELFESTNTPYYFGISSKKCAFQSFLSSKKCSDWPFLSAKRCEIVFLYATRTARFWCMVDDEEDMWCGLMVMLFWSISFHRLIWNPFCPFILCAFLHITKCCWIGKSNLKTA